MAIIYLHGYLGELYGRRFDFDVHSVAEALRLLSANFRGFSGQLLAYKHGFLVRVDGEAAVDVHDLRTTHITPEIHIVPAITGAGGNNGVSQILMGAVMIAAAYYGGFSASTTSTLYGMGANMVLSGVTNLLFSTTSTASSEDLTGEVNQASYAFNGSINTTAQGNPVSVLYGQLMVGSQVISAGVEVR